MTLKQQPDSDTGNLNEGVNDWFRTFLKHLEIFMVQTGSNLGSDSDSADLQLAAMRAVRLSMLESGMDEEVLRSLFGRVAMESTRTGSQQWNPELNARRFTLIDKDIQGALSAAEQIELADLIQRMREHVDSEVYLPFEGARMVHRRLSDMNDHSME